MFSQSPEESLMPTTTSGNALCSLRGDRGRDADARDLRDMVEVDAQRRPVDGVDQPGEVVVEALVRHALVVEGRQDHRAGAALVGGVARQADGVGQAGQPGARGSGARGRCRGRPSPRASPCAPRCRATAPRRWCRRARGRRSPRPAATRHGRDRALGDRQIVVEGGEVRRDHATQRLHARPPIRCRFAGDLNRRGGRCPELRQDRHAPRGGRPAGRAWRSTVPRIAPGRRRGAERREPGAHGRRPQVKRPCT